MLSDAYTGNVAYEDTSDSDSVFSMDYYRSKAREFQTILNQVDETARAANIAIASGIDPELTRDLVGALQEFDAKKTAFRMAAEGINAAAAVINSAGGRFPSLSIPSGLGFAPVAIPAAGLIALATAATLITWGLSWIDGVRERLRVAQLLGVGTPQQQAELARALATAEAAQLASSESPLASIAGVVKWGALGLAAWLAYQAWSRGRG